MTDAAHIYNVAVQHLLAVQTAVDRLHELGAKEQLKLLTDRLQRLAFRSSHEDLAHLQRGLALVEPVARKHLADFGRRGGAPQFRPPAWPPSRWSCWRSP